MTTARGKIRQARRRKVARAAAVSLLFHLVIIWTAAWFYLAQRTPPPPPVEEIEITIIEPPAAKQETMFVETSAPESEPPEQAAFESDRNTAAAAPLAAEEPSPLPSQEGEEQKFVELEQQELALAEPDKAPPAPAMPPAEPAPPLPPQPETTAVTEENEVVEKTEDEALLAMVDPQLKEQKKEETPPPAPPPSRPSFQRQARPTRLRGGVDSLGKASPASLATPLGRYRKQISDAIGSSWYHHIGARMDMFGYGSATVVFEIGPDGKARRPRVVRNTSNESFEIVTLQSILAAKIPPIPPDILPTLEGGRIEIEFSFSIISH
jgi:outer membrane biosynthesis protein TonB